MSHVQLQAALQVQQREHVLMSHISSAGPLAARHPAAAASTVEHRTDIPRPNAPCSSKCDDCARCSRWLDYPRTLEDKNGIRIRGPRILNSQSHIPQGNRRETPAAGSPAAPPDAPPRRGTGRPPALTVPSLV